MGNRIENLYSVGTLGPHPPLCVTIEAACIGVLHQRAVAEGLHGAPYFRRGKRLPDHRSVLRTFRFPGTAPRSGGPPRILERGTRWSRLRLEPRTAHDGACRK